MGSRVFISCGVERVCWWGNLFIFEWDGTTAHTNGGRVFRKISVNWS